MRLVVGGAYQQKKEAACALFGYEPEDFIDGADCGFDEIRSCRAVWNFQEYIRRCMRAGQPVEKLADLLASENPDILIVTDEIGSGVVPMDAEQRAWREQTGRVCCRIAELSDAVVRVTMGISSVIKGSV